MRIEHTGGIETGDIVRLDTGDFEGRLGHCWARGRLKQGDLIVAVQHAGDYFFDYLLVDHTAVVDGGKPTLRLSPVPLTFGAYTLGRVVGRLGDDDLQALLATKVVVIPVPETYETPERTGQEKAEFTTMRELKKALEIVPDNLLDSKVHLTDDSGRSSLGGYVEVDYSAWSAPGEPKRQTAHLMGWD